MRRMLMVAAAVLGAAAAADAADITLVRDGRPAASIVAPAEGPPAHAAEVMQRYVREITGAEMPVVQEPGDGRKNRLLFRTRDGAAELDGYRIRAEGKRVIVEASVPRGCIYGAYGLLRRLGC
ncbi:MAG: glycoside hydrolase family 20 zincin-like fold domain-containing protein, partial [Planctomycetota bacterium]